MKIRLMLVVSVLIIALAALTASAQSDVCKDSETLKCLKEFDYLRLQNNALSVTNIQMQMQLLQKEYLRLNAEYPAVVQSVMDSMELSPKEWQLDGERKAFMKIPPK